MHARIVFAAGALLAGPSLAVAQTLSSGHGSGMDHAAHVQQLTGMTATALTEPGQGAFAALSEVVRVLEADPGTDWSKVNLAGLRSHLVDMDRLISDTVVVETTLPDGLRARATGDAETLATLRRMVPAHAAQLAQDERWTVEASETESGLELRVTSKDPSVADRIKGLGFFGLMTSQDHHREHHMMIARGENPHNP